MSSIADFAPEIQSKLSRFGTKLIRSGFSGPERKNTVQMLWGMLKDRTSHVSVLSRALDEKITPKKTAERLNRNLRKRSYWKRLTVENMRQNKRAIQSKRFCIFDLSDIQKPEAKAMEGVAEVYDGDASTRDETVTGRGFWWLTGLMADREGCLPIYSEVYSLEWERTGENTKLLDAMAMLRRIHPEAIIVFDRGGDRGILINDLIAHQQQFIIRGQNQRHLRLHVDSDKATLIGDIARRMKLQRRYRSRRNGECFDVGIRRVYLGDHSLWLVAARRRDGGLSWYLTSVDGTRESIMDTVMEGYGYRWSIEEFHRQVKQDYGLEQIRLQRYEAIKSMAVLIMLAVSFCAALPANLTVNLIAAARLLERQRLRDIPNYLLYKLTAAVALTLFLADKRPPKPLRIRKRDYFQLTLSLERI